MARTMTWPPTVKDGRVGWSEGADAATTMVIMTLSDLSQNPFNPTDISLGDVTFRSTKLTRSRIEAALRRLSPIIEVESVEETSNDHDGTVVYVVTFSDRETREKRSVSIDG